MGAGRLLGRPHVGVDPGGPVTPTDITILGAALLATLTVAALAGVGIAIWLDGLEGRDWDQETGEKE